MRIAHLADLHLGWRQFDRCDATGCNQREADVEAALVAAVDGIIAARPDLVLIAGDVFHSVRPTNRAILAAFREVTRLRGCTSFDGPAPDVVVIAGNHDTPRSAETGRILPLLEQAGARVVVTDAARIEVPGATVTAVPSAAAECGRIPGPLADARRNILLLHGDLIGYPSAALTFRGTGRLDPDALAVGWDYVALGDYHNAAEVRPRMWYSGSLEYTSSNPWIDIAAGPKGWLLVELIDGEPPRVTPVPIPVRRHIDVPPFDATGMTAADVDARIAERFAEFPVDGAVVRLVILNIARATARALDHARLRGWKAAALNLHLDLRRPDAETSTPERRAMLHVSLDQKVETFLRGAPLPPDLEARRPDFVQRGMKYFDEARREDVDP